MQTKDYLLAIACIALGILIGWLIWHGETTPAISVNKGEHWAYKDDIDNPFRQNDYYIVDDVKGGWVQYQFVMNNSVGKVKYTTPVKEFIRNKAKRMSNDTN